MAKGRARIVPALKNAVMADYVVLGGGSVKKMEELPDGVRRGHNRTVVEGGPQTVGRAARSSSP